jgi:hypothetical protein
MEVLNRDTATVKIETADVRALLHARLGGNGHARVNGHARNGGNGHRRGVRRQIQHGYRRAVLRADTAVMLVKMTGMSVTEAIERCGTSTDYYYAMKAVRESGDTALYRAVLRDHTPFFASAARVKNAAAVITAYRKCSEFEKGMILVATGLTTDLATMLRRATPDQLAEASNLLGLDWVWDNMIAAAMPTTSATKPAAAKKMEVTEPATTNAA